MECRTSVLWLRSYLLGTVFEQSYDPAAAIG